MSQLTAIENAQKSLEESFTKRMTELEAQLHIGVPGKETVAKVAEEFRTFRELMYSMLGLLRKQIDECSRQVDVLETRYRRKALIFLGVAEQENEDSASVILDVVRRFMALSEVTASDIDACYRLGAPSKDHHRPILVRFANIRSRSAVWSVKTKLKGSPVSVREFLTKTRQSVFSAARLHFGMRACWTQDGIIVIKTRDGNRHKVTTMNELNPLTRKYPKAPGDCSAETSSGSGKASAPIFTKPRKN